MHGWGSNVGGTTKALQPLVPGGMRGFFVGHRSPFASRDEWLPRGPFPHREGGWGLGKENDT